MMTTGQANYYLVVMGKAGTGKTTTCNQLLGSEQFRVYRGNEGKTRTVQLKVKRKDSIRLTIIDTPDFFNMGLDDVTAVEELRDWERFASGAPGPTAFLFTVRLDIRFSDHDYDLYRRFHESLPEYLRGNVILAFTRLEGLQREVCDEVKLSAVKDLLDDAQRRYLCFSPGEEKTEQNLERVVRWMTGMSGMRRESRKPFKLAHLWSFRRWAVGLLGVLGFIAFASLYLHTGDCVPPYFSWARCYSVFSWPWCHANVGVRTKVQTMSSKKLIFGNGCF